MTATASEGDIRTLHRLFGSGGEPLLAAGAAALRSELSYLTVHCKSNEERRGRLLEAVDNLPRPLFIYAATRTDVSEIQRDLIGRGYRRVVAVTGDSSERERRSAIAALRGVNGGEDQKALRWGRLPSASASTSLTYAASSMPASRKRSTATTKKPGVPDDDGMAALALLLWTDSDVEIAKNLARRKLITVELAREKWAGLLAHSARQEGTVWAPLDALRIGQFEASGWNTEWNSRTLAAMARAGLIELRGFRMDDDGPKVAVGIARGDLASDDAWIGLATTRGRSHTEDRRQVERMLTIARSGDVCPVLQDTYEVNLPDKLSAPLLPVCACGGCSACLHSHARPPIVPPLPLGPPESDYPLPSGLARYAARGRGEIIVDEGSDGWDRRYAEAVLGLARAGVLNLVCTRPLRETVLSRRALRRLAVELRAGSAHSHRTLRTPRGRGHHRRSADVAPRRSEDNLASILYLRSFPTFRRTLLIAVVPGTRQSWIREDVTIREMLPGAPTIQAHSLSSVNS